MNTNCKGVWLIFLAALMLAGCQTNQVTTQTSELASSASVPSSQEQAQRLLSQNPKLTTVYIFVPKLLRATDYANSMNGRTANLRVNLNGKTIAILPVQRGLKLELLPNQQYNFVYGEDWEQQNEHMLRKVVLKTLAPGTFKAFDVYTEMEHANVAEVKRLTVNETLDRLNSYAMVQAKVPMPEIALAANGFNQQLDSCLKQNELPPCQQLVQRLPKGFAPNSIVEHIKLIETEQARKQQLIAMEEALPTSVRRDKYMVQLSSFLKKQNYKAALDVFPKLEALPIATDPSLKYFYGEALLKTNQHAKAMQKLYQYINEQGTSATHYAQALEMINDAESKL
ncbi:hypothetical protein SAMN03080615_02972 [Amphritea atlantica]|uniref:Tetratricopeptide repeat-containing protein n=1 Tax=Amphritea atlantica TaxID=355243 RepID=A0A1H9JFI6_9GAMM|nr:hypothetical protein [Amphritea atlantica]SEQ85596.1 hypothetical protein SAMN03080615_02972 [Amphritea atlantica]